MSRAPIIPAGNLEGRRYVWPPNTTDNVVPSVTTILKQVALQKHLVPAAGWRVAEYAVDNILQWESMPPADAKQLLAGVARRNWKQKANLGTAIHDAVEAYLDNQPEISLDSRTTPYTAGAVAYLQQHVTEILHYEAVIYNLEYQYAGRCDLIARLNNGNVAVVDWKSGHVSPTHALQLSAYANGEFIGNDQGEQTPLPEIVEGVIVQLPGDGTYKAYPVTLDDRTYRTFIAYRTVQKWVDQHRDGALGDPIEPSPGQGDEHAATTN